MSALKINSDGYISIPGKDWGDIIILKKDKLDELLNNSSQSTFLDSSSRINDTDDLARHEFVRDVKILIEKYSMRQREISELVGVNQPTVSRLLSKNPNIISPKYLVRNKFKKVFNDETKLRKSLEKLRANNG